MPISRDPRMDRRRRMLMDNTDGGDQDRPAKRGGGRSNRNTQQDTARPKRVAGYSQEVRHACGQRLVQLIPVRLRSYLAVIACSLLVPSILLLGHYMVYVVGNPPWYGHPLAGLLDMSRQDSIAAWLSSHIWLLCLGATVLTFQLRRHKLDDYEGEYRLWFWLVMTCLVASMDSTTRISNLFGLALERWSQLNLGWSGPAVVQTTLIALVGMLGLRLCSELKTVPASLVFWLTGLVCWAGSAALGQELLRVDMTDQFRIWLKYALWLGGLTSVWLSALSYLRQIYIDAQRRFLARGRLASVSTAPIGERIRESIPKLPSFRRGDSQGDEGNASRWQLPSFRRSKADDDATPLEKPARRKRTTAAQEVASDDPTSRERAATKEESAKRPSRFTKWLKQPKDSDEPDEYKKVVRQPSQKAPATAKSRSTDSQSDDSELDASPRKKWFSQIPKPSLKMPKLPKLRRNSDKATDAGPASKEDSAQPANNASQAKATAGKTKPAKATKSKSKGGFFSRFKLPSFRLPPPGGKEEANDEANDNPAGNPGTRSNNSQPTGGLRSVSTSNSELPGTYSDEDDDSNGRPLSKAERKRLRRQRQNRAA